MLIVGGKVMPRDWEAEWSELLAEQDEALEAQRKAYASLFPVFSRSGAPSEEELRAGEDGDQRADEAKRKIDAFIADWRRSQG